MLLGPKLNAIATYVQCPIRGVASMQVCRNGVKAMEHTNRLE